MQCNAIGRAVVRFKKRRIAYHRVRVSPENLICMQRAQVEPRCAPHTRRATCRDRLCKRAANWEGLRAVEPRVTVTWVEAKLRGAEMPADAGA